MLRRLGIALLLAASAAVALTAQTPANGNPHPHPPNHVRPAPHPSGYRPNHRPAYGNGTYPVVIDGSVINRFLATPPPKPRPKHTAAPKTTSDGQEIFKSLSTSDNGK